VDPMFSDAAAGNFQTQSTAVIGYGAYAP